MTKYTVITLICTLVILFSAVCVAQEKEMDNTKTTFRVGTYDSRAVALAYWRSDMSKIKEFHNKLKAELEKAKEAGDEKRVKEIESQGKAMQATMHKQVFGNAPIRDIIKEIKDKLPDIAQKANVDIIVRIWDIAYQAPSSKFVDVTDHIVALFNPTEKTLKIVKEMRDHAPVSEEELDKIECNPDNKK